MVISAESIALDNFESARFKKTRTWSPCFFYPRLAHAFKSPGATPGRLKHKLLVVIDEKVRAFVKTSKALFASPRFHLLFPAKSTG
jgi:hypothetical protein